MWKTTCMAPFSKARQGKWPCRYSRFLGSRISGPGFSLQILSINLERLRQKHGQPTPGNQSSQSFPTVPASKETSRLIARPNLPSMTRYYGRGQTLHSRRRLRLRPDLRRARILCSARRGAADTNEIDWRVSAKSNLPDLRHPACPARSPQVQDQAPRRRRHCRVGQQIK